MAHDTFTSNMKINWALTAKSSYCGSNADGPVSAPRGAHAQVRRPRQQSLRDQPSDSSSAHGAGRPGRAVLRFARGVCAMALVVVTATLVAGCHQGSPSSTEDARRSSAGTAGDGTLRLPSPMPPWGLGMSRKAAQQPVAVYAGNVCPEGGPAQITSIELKDATNLSVVDWGVRPYPAPGEALGQWDGTVLSDATFAQNPVSGSCKSHSLSELAISVRREDGVGVAHGFNVVNGTDKVFVPMRIVVCPQACPPELMDGPIP